MLSAIYIEEMQKMSKIGIFCGTALVNGLWNIQISAVQDVQLQVRILRRIFNG